MNYYPNNFYGNYPYNQNFSSNNFFGKIVDGEEIVKATDIPFGGYGIFPKADFSEIFIKTWNRDGTTRLISFKPIEPIQEDKIDTNSILLEKISNIEENLNKILSVNTTKQDNKNSNTSTLTEKRKDVNINAY